MLIFLQIPRRSPRKIRGLQKNQPFHGDLNFGRADNIPRTRRAARGVFSDRTGNPTATSSLSTRYSAPVEEALMHSYRHILVPRLCLGTRCVAGSTCRQHFHLPIRRYSRQSLDHLFHGLQRSQDRPAFSAPRTPRKLQKPETYACFLSFLNNCPSGGRPATRCIILQRSRRAAGDAAQAQVLIPIDKPGRSDVDGRRERRLET
jgi:hypothetical protein